MADNTVLNAGTGGDTLTTKEISHGGDTTKLQTVSLMGVSGTEGSYTVADINGDAANGLDVDVTRVSGTVAVSNAGLTELAAAIDTEVQCDIVGALPAGTNAIGKLAANSGVDIGDVDVTSVVPGTGATNLGKAEDAAHSSGNVGVMALTVRQDTAAALADTDADYQPLITDANGRLHVNAGTVTVARTVLDFFPVAFRSLYVVFRARLTLVTICGMSITQ